MESESTHRAREVLGDDSKGVICPWCCFTFDPNKAWQHEAECAQESKEPVDQGQLGSVAASVLMKCLFLARRARFDLLRAVQGLARFVTKWSIKQDAAIHRLICYIHTTKGWRMIGWIGDDASDLGGHCYSDADYAGCGESEKSTSGVHVCVKGPHSSFPISGISRRQGCVSHSTAESELVAGDLGLRTVAIPAEGIFNLIFGTKATVFHADNKAMIDILRTWRSPTMRYGGTLEGYMVCLSLGCMSISVKNMRCCCIPRRP